MTASPPVPEYSEGKAAFLKAAEEFLGDWNNQGKTRIRREIVPLLAGRCLFDGQELVNFASNDYLGLAGDARVVAAGHAALDTMGHGARASALVSGRTPFHADLESALATFENVESVLLFPSGFAANLGAISGLVGPGDTVYCEHSNHASLIDGCRLSGARLRLYRDHQLDRLQRLLQKSAPGKRLIVTDSVFSMDGTLASLVELCDLADCYDAAVLVDEAHATGVFGEHGRGACELLNVEERVLARVGTLSKALGGIGGFVAGPRVIIDRLWHSGRTQVFSTALPPANCAMTHAALTILQEEPARRQHLATLSRSLRILAIKNNLTVINGSQGPIVPFIVGDACQTSRAADQLRELGFLVAAIRPPTVPDGTARLRVSLTAAHSLTDVSGLIEALARTVPEAHGSFPK